MTKKILCICPNPAIDVFSFVENIVAGETNRILKEQKYVGGKAIHVAMAIKEFGEEVDVAAIWAGATGDWMKAELKKMNINYFGTTVSGWNRINTTVRSENQWNDTEFVGAGPTISKAEYDDFVNTISAKINNYQLVVMSGSWPAGAPLDAYGALIDLCSLNDIKVILDCSGTNLQHALQHKPYMLHVNQKEMEQSVPNEYRKNPAEYFLKYIKVVAITAGSEGLFLQSADQKIHAKCKLEKIISAVGSGDCLTAGLALSMIKKLTFVEMAKFACACGSANCMREELGMLYKSDVENLLKIVTIQ